MPQKSFVRAAALGTSIAAIALTLVAVPIATAPVAIADSASCTPIGDYPNPTNQRFGVPSGFAGTDTAVGTYIAGDFDVVTGSAEAEGITVVGGDATFNTGGYFNVGTVGVGSQVVPPAGSDMLTTGGDVVVGTTTTLDVGNNRGGNIRAGGTFTPGATDAKYTFNGGAGFPNTVDPLAPYAASAAAFATLSTQLAGLPADGTVDLSTPNQVHLVGDGTSTRQIFSVPGSVLGSPTNQIGIYFDNIASNAVIVVNVTGATASLGAWGFYVNGAMLDHTPLVDRTFANWSQSITWNFPTATDVSLSLNTQLPGAVMIPTAGSDLELRTTINGRLYVNGDVTMGGGASTGLEIHNYGQRTCSLASTATGSFEIAKAIVNPAAVAITTTSYTGTYSCIDSNASVVASGSWSVTASTKQTVTGLPIGATCSVVETAPADPATGYVWAAPGYSPATVSVSTSTTPTITVTNTVAQEVGSLRITKAAITGITGIADPSRVYRGTWSCVSGSTPAGNGTWAVAAGASTTIANVPDGATCSVIETSLTTGPSATDPSYRWNAPVYSPGTALIATGVTTTIEVQNSVRRAFGDLELRKILDDPYDVVDLSRVYTGTWSCTLGGSTIAGGTWSETAGSAPVRLATGLPAGAVCTAAEDAATLDAPPLTGFPQYLWLSPVITPSTVTIAENTVGLITVTNIVHDPIDVLAHAGAEVTAAVVAGLALLGLGIGLVVLRRRRVVAERGNA